MDMGFGQDGFGRDDFSGRDELTRRGSDLDHDVFAHDDFPQDDFGLEEHASADAGDPNAEGNVDDRMFDLGGDERRMHVRAYNHWVSLLKGRAYPSIEDLEPENIVDFGPHSVLLDFGGDVADPAIAYLGGALREECGLDTPPSHIADVPSRSLLSRLTDHYLQIIANRAPIGFEAEFVSTRGRTTAYRGILMPFSSGAGQDIDFIYGVINWKEAADPMTQAALDLELEAAVRAAPHARDAAVWADGPGAESDHQDGDREADPAATLGDALTLARETAAQVHVADTRSRAALYRALGRAHDFALVAADDAEGYQELLTDAGLTVQARAPMTPIVKLVFGADYDKTRITEFASVLGHAQRSGIARGGLAGFLESFDGGIKAVVAAERDARRPAAKPAPAAIARPVLARVEIDTGAKVGDTIVLVARVGEDGVLDVIAHHNDAKLAARALAAKAPRGRR
nr:hypothetical protein [Sphingomonas sp. Leaf343]